MEQQQEPSPEIVNGVAYFCRNIVSLGSPLDNGWSGYPAGYLFFLTFCVPTKNRYKDGYYDFIVDE